MDAGRERYIRARARTACIEILITLTEEWVRADVERRFGLNAPPDIATSRGIGAEIELLPQFADSHLSVPAAASAGVSSVGVVRQIARTACWCEKAEDSDPPSWILGGGARVSFEPGGQVEISSARHGTATDLIAELQSITTTLIDAFDRNGIQLESAGVDPWNDIDAVPQQLRRGRYATMTRYFESLGPSGIRMMRQTASIQVNVDPGANPIARWTLLNALAPYLTAMFANSSRYAGRVTGHRSYRAHLWRTLDSSRTGAARPSERSIGDYALFALNAGAMFSTPRDGRYPSFLEWMGDGQRTRSDWELHVSTLFPEVRPKGFFEIRSPDMVDPRMIAAPIAFIAGLVYDARAAEDAADVLAASDEPLLVRAGVNGLRDTAVASVSRELAALAVAGCRSLGESYVSRDDIDTLVEFVDRYTRNGRSPADDQ